MRKRPSRPHLHSVCWNANLSLKNSLTRYVFPIRRRPYMATNSDSSYVIALCRADTSRFLPTIDLLLFKTSLIHHISALGTSMQERISCVICWDCFLPCLHTTRRKVTRLCRTGHSFRRYFILHPFFTLYHHYTDLGSGRFPQNSQNVYYGVIPHSVTTRRGGANLQSARNRNDLTCSYLVSSRAQQRVSARCGSRG